MKQEAFRKLFPQPDYAEMTARLRRPAGKVDVILDTDAYNEIDDQFALAYLVRSEESVNMKAITAAPFYRDPSIGVCRSKDPADGMELSYHEIIKVLKLAGREDLCCKVYRGSTCYLPGETTPVSSEAVDKILEISRDYSETNPLYIVALGASTNVASALLTDPTLIKRCVVVWLAGHAHHWNDCSDFNVAQDMYAARILFGCGVPLVQFPMFGVVAEFRFSKPELEYWFRDKNDLCNYLIDNTYEYNKLKYNYEGWSKPLWDLATACWVVQGDFVKCACVPAPVPTWDYGYSIDMTRHPMQYIYCVNKDQLIADIAAKLGR